jgi:hypothetical protein
MGTGAAKSAAYSSHQCVGLVAIYLHAAQGQSGRFTVGVCPLPWPTTHALVPHPLNAAHEKLSCDVRYESYVHCIAHNEMRV